MHTYAPTSYLCNFRQNESLAQKLQLRTITTAIYITAITVSRRAPWWWCLPSLSSLGPPGGNCLLGKLPGYRQSFHNANQPFVTSVGEGNTRYYQLSSSPYSRGDGQGTRLCNCQRAGRSQVWECRRGTNRTCWEILGCFLVRASNRREIVILL